MTVPCFNNNVDQLINDNASVLRDTLFPTVFDAIRASQGITINSDLENKKSDIIIVNKPSGMVVHPSFGHFTGTLMNGIKYNFEILLLRIHLKFPLA